MTPTSTSVLQRLIERLGLEERVRKEKARRTLMQCSLAALVVLIVLFLLDAVTQTVLIASLGASAFIAFALPRSLHSSPRHLIGGYVVGMLAGALMWLVSVPWQFANPVLEHAVTILFGALAIGLAMFLMVVTKTEHPPAAALALGLVLNEWDMVTLLVVFSGVIALSLLKRLVLPVLMDLI